jgi:hypothetical protein
MLKHLNIELRMRFLDLIIMITKDEIIVLIKLHDNFLGQKLSKIIKITFYSLNTG